MKTDICRINNVYQCLSVWSCLAGVGCGEDIMKLSADLGLKVGPVSVMLALGV